MRFILFTKNKRILIRLSVLVFVVRLTCLGSFSQDFSRDPHAWMSEAFAREASVSRVIPIYPEDASSQKVSGVVRVKIEISGEGEILRIKLKPRTNPVFKEVVVDAVKQWKFKPHHFPDDSNRPMPIISRLTFVFWIENGKSWVDLYDPGPNPTDLAQLGYLNSAKELREWKEWEEVWARTVSREK